MGRPDNKTEPRLSAKTLGHLGTAARPRFATHLERAIGPRWPALALDWKARQARDCAGQTLPGGQIRFRRATNEPINWRRMQAPTHDSRAGFVFAPLARLARLINANAPSSISARGAWPGCKIEAPASHWWRARPDGSLARALGIYHWRRWAGLCARACKRTSLAPSWAWVLNLIEPSRVAGPSGAAGALNQLTGQPAGLEC